LFDPPNALQACSSGVTVDTSVSDYYTRKYRIPKLPILHKAKRPYAFFMGFNERLREARLAADLSGDKLGKAVGYSKQTVSHWEAGRFEPNMETIVKLCQVLDVPADWLLLGKAPEELSAAALREARFYDALTPQAKRKWETAKMLVREAISDAVVEAKMPITKAPAFSAPAKPAKTIKGDS